MSELEYRQITDINEDRDLDVRGVIARVAEIMRARFDAAGALAEPTYKTLEELAELSETVTSKLLKYANDLGPEEVRVRGLFYALGDPPSIELQTDQILTLQREPGNQKDPRAIGLFAECGTRIGYVPKRTAEYLSPLLDEGVPVPTAWLSHGEGTEWHACLNGPAVLAMRTAKKVKEWCDPNEIPF